MTLESHESVEVLERDGYLEAHYLGRYSFDGYVRQMEASILACTKRDLDLLLVDIRSLEGYTPTTYERHQIGIAGASLSRGLSKVAVLATREQVGSDEFSTTVARNRGLSIQAFQDRDEALRWLLAPPKRPES
jgi:hypothetical protein